MCYQSPPNIHLYFHCCFPLNVNTCHLGAWITLTKQIERTRRIKEKIAIYSGNVIEKENKRTLHSKKKKRVTYSHNIKGRGSVGSFAIFTMSWTRIYMGHIMNYDSCIQKSGTLALLNRLTFIMDMALKAVLLNLWKFESHGNFIFLLFFLLIWNLLISVNTHVQL